MCIMIMKTYFRAFDHTRNVSKIKNVQNQIMIYTLSLTLNLVIQLMSLSKNSGIHEYINKYKYIM